MKTRFHVFFPILSLFRKVIAELFPFIISDTLVTHKNNPTIRIDDRVILTTDL